ncbi:YigZ family protein [Mycoplasmopsis caviae]|uniref:Proline dipeptidase pepQ n=1 Tax=Mycoplasmopsis caviae TaxID=55603 RepID=A0A3P8KWQ8_9BACT|nr:YigZ family protein [Mycoplasmopsis caviae]UUD35334.1 YigZ family protein [Mycoplasmopsis caviae]VDR41887.1 proline dipeptidase pepQ [Mycoplasmopsis caviae]
MQAQLYEIKKSKFYSYVFKINSKEEIKNIEANLRIEHKKATHICYGYSFLNSGVLNAGFSDDGEPNGTAGRPIRDLLIVRKINGLVVFVVRYYGGIKLGAGGLARTYIKSANLAIEQFIKDGS